LDNQTRDGYKNSLKEIMKAIADKSERLNPLYEKIDEVFYHYEKYEEIMRGKMVKKDAVLAEDEFLDHHKIAAAFCYSVIKARPIDYVTDDSGVSPTDMEKAANEHCAFLFGMQVIQNFWSIKAKENIPVEDKEIYNNPIKLPQPNDTTTTYNDWFIKLLNKEAFKHFDYGNNKFGGTLIFFIAHIYFLIESYSYQYYKKTE